MKNLILQKHLLLLFLVSTGIPGTTSLCAAPDPTQTKVLYMVANAHLDTQWNWTIQDTINRYIPATLTNNFELFAKYPDYTFSFEGAFRYRLAKEYYPQWYSTMSNHVRQGRWRVAGSAVDAGDVNIPSPESLFRQILYANNFWEREFGKTSTDIFLPDCFGFGYALPSIAAHCGIKGFSSQKLSWGSAIPLPFRIGRWVGPDGNSIVAALDPGSYTSTISENLANSTFYEGRIAQMGAATGLHIDYRYFGTGDTGGSPTDSSVNWLQQSVTTSNGLINVISAASDQMFRDLAPEHVSVLPSYQGELLMTAHGSGCYTAHPEMKMYNRQNELRADAAERCWVMADWLKGDSYPREKLTRAWQRFLWHQFHDDLTGTSIPAAYTFSWNDELISLNEFNYEVLHAAAVIAAAMDTQVSGIPLVVYNSLGFPREDVVEATLQFSNAAPAFVRVFDPAGNEIPSQSGPPADDRIPVTFIATVPANGAAVFEARPSTVPCALDTGLAASPSQLENARYRVQIDPNGDVASVFDKIHSRELLSAPIRWTFLPDVSVNWPSWEILYSAVTAKPYAYLGEPASITVAETGPARATVEITRFGANSCFSEALRLAAGAAGDRLEWDVSVNWGGAKTLAKIAFPLAVTNAAATYDLGLGVIQRTNNSQRLYEVPAQQWSDLANSNQSYGITILSDSKYGWDKPDHNTLRLTAFHTPDTGGSWSYQAYDGIGSHRFSFGLMGHSNDWRSARSPDVAARFNQPLEAFQASVHPGTIGKTFSFLTCNNSNVMIKAIKKAETSGEIVIRLQETTGQPQSAQLLFAAPIVTARQTTGTEQTLDTLTPSGHALSLSFGPYEPMTIALNLAANPSPVPPSLSTPIALPYNLDAVSSDADRTDGDFDLGYTYPAELLPPTITQDGVTFQMGPSAKGYPNAVACEAQTIMLPAGYQHVDILAAATSTNVPATFLVGTVSSVLNVGYFTGFIGQWSPPSLRKDEIAWVCTHRHTASGQNEAYRFCYLFRYRLTIPPGATTLSLPNDRRVRVFAMCATRNAPAEIIPAGGALTKNELPWAAAGPNRTVNAPSTNQPATVVLSAAGSTDADGSIVRFEWSTGGTLLATTSNAVVNLPVGMHNLLLKVYDDQGGVGSDVVTITVLEPLLVTISAVPTNASAPPVTVQFTASARAGFPVEARDTTDEQDGTVSAQGQNTPGEGAAKAFDNSNSSKWLDFANSNPETRASWIQYQYPGGTAYVVTNYTITSANDFPDRDPANWRLLASNDGAIWSTLDSRTGEDFPARFQKREFPIVNDTGYKIYRLQIDRVANPAGANSIQLSEIELIGTPAYSYAWSFGDGDSSSIQSPQHTYARAGNFLAVLTISYGIYSGSNAVIITVGPPLTAMLTASQIIGPAPVTVQFSALAAGGNGERTPYNTTFDRRGAVTAQGSNPPNETAAKAFDGSSGTKWLDFAPNFPETRASWIQYEYAGGARCRLSQYTITSANDFPDRDPATWKLLGSNDGGATWDALDTRTNEFFAGRFERHTYSCGNTNAYNLLRLAISSVIGAGTANSVQLSEIELIGTPVYTFAWNFGDGTTSALRNPAHTYTNNGVYPVTLAVSDGIAQVIETTTIQVAPLVLSIGQETPEAITLAWPTWASNHALVSTTNLVPPLVWAPVTNTPIPVDNQLRLILPLGITQQYFYLRRD